MIFGALCGCSQMKRVLPSSLSDWDIVRLQETERQMLQGYTEEVEIDRKIAAAVKQMVATLKPEYRNRRFGKHKLGFLEISDIDRRTVKKFHNYVTEKTLTFSFLQPPIARNFDIVERFLLKDILRELDIQNIDSPTIIDQAMAKRLGKIYGLDIIETGVVTASSDFIDINLRMIETKRGRIIAVGSAKIDRMKVARKWLQEYGSIGTGWPTQTQ